MEPIIRHYTKTTFQPFASGGPVIAFNNLSVQYLVQEITEGTHGPLAAGPCKVEEFFVAGKCAQGTLYYKESKWQRYKYDFVVVIDLDWLKKSEEGNRLLNTYALSYDKKVIRSKEADTFRKEGELAKYLGADLSCSFDITILRALGMEQMCPDATATNDEKKKYVDRLSWAIRAAEFIPAVVPRFVEVIEPLKMTYSKNFYRGYVYEAFSRII